MNGKWKGALGSVLAVTAIGGVLALDVNSQPAQREKTALSSPAVADEYSAAWEDVKRDAEQEKWVRGVKEAFERLSEEMDAETRADRVARGLPAEPTVEETAYTDALGAHTEAMLDVVQAGCGWDGGDFDARLHGTNYGWCTADESGRGIDVALSHTREACAVVQGRWTQQGDRYPDLKSAGDAVVAVGPTDAVSPVTGTCVLTKGKPS